MKGKYWGKKRKALYKCRFCNFNSLLPLYSIFNHLQDRTRVGCDSGPHVSALLGNRARDGRSLHLTLVVDNDTSVILEVDKGALLAAPALSLADNHDRVDLLSQLGLSLLAGSHNQTANGSRRKSVLSTLDTTDSNDLHGLSSTVVGTIDDGSDRQTKSGSELSSDSTSTSWSNEETIIKKNGTQKYA